MNVTDFTNLILSFDSYSPKKLQKLAYYVYSWYYTLTKEKIADLNFEAWVHGPVSADIYAKFKSYGWNCVPKRSTKYNENSLVFKVAEKVIQNYGNLSADQLEIMTHKEAPWLNARNGYSEYESSKEIISDNDIYNFYSKHYYAQDFFSLIEH